MSGRAPSKTRTCDACGTSLRPAARFCDACGHRLAPAGAAPASGAAAPGYTPRHLADEVLGRRSAQEGERKLVTVLFADVKGSMELAEQVDAERWHRILDRFFQVLTDGVHRFEGTVNQYTGDGIMALFGAPVAHEDHAQRACHAALHLRDELRRYADELRREGIAFSVRMGLNSGEVVVGRIGDDMRMDYTAQGPVVGIAARMEQLAEPGRVYVADATARLVDGWFELRDLGESRVKGVPRPVHVYELRGVGKARTRFDVSRARGLSRFVGREREMAVLQAALDEALAGRGQAVALVAEAGVGKSRLCYEFLAGCRARGIVVAEANCAAHARRVPFFSLLGLLRSLFEIGEHEAPLRARERIAGRLLLLDRAFEDDLALLFDFLGVPDEAHVPPRIDPEARQRRVAGFLGRLLRAWTERASLVLVVEDLHWIDPASRALGEHILAALRELPILHLVTLRPEGRALAMRPAAYRELVVEPLAPEAGRELAETLLGRDPSVARLADLVQERTAGNPFFIEELVESLRESGALEGERGALRLARAVDAVVMPESAQALLSARIDRLADDSKTVLQTAAVIGRSFAPTVLAAVLGRPAGDLAGILDELVAADFLQRDGAAGAPSYSFRHPLTQEAAYRSQLGDVRARCHGAVAAALEALHGERAPEHAALLASHYEAAGRKLEAARWHERAARWAGLHDRTEALRHWRAVRALIADDPHGEDTRRLALSACLGLLHHGAFFGESESELAAIFAEGSELAERAGNGEAAVLIRLGFAVARHLAGASREALEYLGEATRRAEAASRDDLFYLTSCVLVETLLTTGAVREALAASERAMAIADGDEDLCAHRAGFSPLAALTTLRGLLRALAGDVGAGLRDVEAGMEIARRRGDLEVVATGCHDLVVVGDLAGDSARALEWGRCAVEIAERSGSPVLLASAWGALGQAQRLHGRCAEAVESSKRALALVHERRTALNAEAFYLIELAQAYLGRDDLLGAHTSVERAVATARQRGNQVQLLMALLARVRIQLATEGSAARDETETTLRECDELVRRTGAHALAPRVHAERAGLLRLAGEQRAAVRELDCVRALYEKMGAAGHASALAAPQAP